MFRAAALFVSVPLFCISCSDPAIEPSQSLVGAKNLPSAEELSQETIFIGRHGGPFGGDILRYEWHPNDTITVTHSFSDNNPGEIIKGQEVLRIPSKDAAAARRLLWRVRPDILEGMEGFVQDNRPVGCVRHGPHDLGEISIMFHKYGSKPGIEDDIAGTFRLPAAGSCATPAAAEAQEVVREVLSLLPASRVAAGFDEST